MALTPAQLTALKADIALNNATTPQYPGVAIKNLAVGSDTAAAIAAWYSDFTAPDYFVWHSEVPAGDVFDKVTWANFTPADAPDNTVTYQNRAMLCQTKQMNLQLLLQGRTSFDATKVNLRSGLNDATTNLPSGTAGANRSGGWAAILPILSRKATRVEKLFAVDDGVGIGNTTTDPRGANTNPDTAAFTGGVGGQDVSTARELP